MPSFRYQALGPLPSAGGSSAFLGLVILDEARAEPVVLVWVPEEAAQDIEKSERIQRETERAAGELRLGDLHRVRGPFEHDVVALELHHHLVVRMKCPELGDRTP